MSTQETESNESTVGNENINVKVTQSPGCRVKLEITVTPEGVKAARLNAIKNIRKEVSIPGFRKGKAPDQFILENYKSAIEKETASVATNTAINESLNLTQLHPLENKLLKAPVVHSCNAEGARITCEFETYAQVPFVELEGINLNKPQFLSLSDEEVQNTLDRLAQEHATYEPIEERGVEKGDFVNLSITLLEEPPKEVVKDQRAEVADQKIPSWILNKILGMKTSESTEGMTELDPTFDEPHADFESKPFRVTIHKIWKKVLPEIDDAFAQKMKLQTLDELKEKIRTNLQYEIEQENARMEEEELDRFLIEKYPFEIPRSIVDQYKTKQLEAYLESLQKQNVSYSREDRRNIEKDIEESVIRRFKVQLLLSQIRKNNTIALEQNDITEELTRQVHQAQSGRSAINFSDEKDNVMQQLNHIALDRKTRKFLLEHASFN